MRQEVKFVFDNEEFECEVVWKDDCETEIRFFDPNNGYQNSNPSSVQQNWYYQNHEAQKNMNSLINAVQQWEDWSDFINWEDGYTNIFEFEWDGKTFEGCDGEYKTLTRV